MGTNTKASIPFSELSKNVRKVAIRSKQQVLKGNPEDNKKPWGRWDQYPKDYSGEINDPKYPTAFLCDYIPKLELYLAIIDLDAPKEEHHIPLNILKSAAAKMIESTYSVQTASGGYHIYLLSKEKPQAKQSAKLNIDYQTNTGEGRGKYVLTDYRWNKDGKKEYYKRLVESPKHVAIRENTDKVLNDFLENLQEKGYIKTAQNELINTIIEILKPEVKRGDRQHFSCCLAGYLRKEGFKQKTTRTIIKGVFAEDEELPSRLKTVKQTYKVDIKKIKGHSYLKKLLPPVVMEELRTKTQNRSTNLREIIAGKLLKHKKPSPKEVSDLINSDFDFYKNHQTQLYYERLEHGKYQEITYLRILEYCNEIFGSNQVPESISKEVLQYITKPIEKNYDIIEFENGILNTKTKEFTTDKTGIRQIPKISLPFNWREDADGGYIQKVFEEILDYHNNPENMELWLKLVGHMFMAWNTIAKFMMVVGPSRSGKSTLSTALERIFNVSRVSTQRIVANERFALLDMIDKDLNIDDDINNGMLKGIGYLNTVVAGQSLSIEKKGLNEFVKLTNPQIPILIANGNTLPPVIGEGFTNRLALIKAPHQKPVGERDETLHSRIQQGEHDKELEWLVYTAINKYWENEGKPLISQQLEEEQEREYQLQSYPLLTAIQELFSDDFEEWGSIPVREVNRYVLLWFRHAYKKGKISKEHLNPSTTQIRNAMDKKAYFQKTEHYFDGELRTTQKVYEYIKTTDLVRFILGEKKRLVDNILLFSPFLHFSRKTF